MRTGGIVTAAVGGAALIAGVIFNLEANSKVRSLTPNYDKEADSSSKTYKTLSLAGYGTGAACLVGGAILYYLGWKSGSSGQVALLPSATHDSAGALLTGAF